MNENGEGWLGSPPLDGETPPTEMEHKHIESNLTLPEGTNQDQIQTRHHGDAAECECASTTCLPFQSPARPLPPVARRIGAQATTRRDFTVHAPLPAFPLAMIRYSGAMPLHAPRWLRVGAIRRGDVPEACAVLCRSSCRQRAQGMAPLYGFMHGHELAIDGARIDTGLHALQGKRSCKRISRGFIKKKWYTATTRQWQRRPWRQRTTAYKITHTPTVVLYMQISKRI